MPRVLFGVTSGVSIAGFMKGQAPYFAAHGWDCHLVCAPSPGLDHVVATEGFTYHPAGLERNPNPLSDLRGLVQLWRTVGKVKPAVAVWGTPKASLLGTIVCRLRGIPSVYTIHGLRLEGSTGWKRQVLIAAERATCALATQVVIVGYELRDRAIDLKLAPPERLSILADGSANGVPAAFSPPHYRRDLDLGEAPLVVFVGRITTDKGVRELAEAWPQIVAEIPDAHLLVAGTADAADPHGQELADLLAGAPQVHLLGYINDVDALWGDADLLVLPSYREGLPLCVIEAAAAGVPTVVTDCTGGAESVVDGETGRVIAKRDVPALVEAVTSALRDRTQLASWGESARLRAQTRYNRTRLWDAWLGVLSKVGKK